MIPYKIMIHDSKNNSMIHYLNRDNLSQLLYLMYHILLSLFTEPGLFVVSYKRKNPSHLCMSVYKNVYHLMASNKFFTLTFAFRVANYTIFYHGHRY